MNNTELARQAESIKSDLDRLDSLLDSMTEAQALSLSKVYESVSIILKAQYTLIKNRPGLRVVED
jgi:hypothetical protein